MSWLDDLRRDPDGTHARLVHKLYRQRIAAAFATPFLSECKEGRRQAIVPIDVECPLILIPPTDADEIIIAFQNGRRLCVDRSQAQGWRHMIAIWVDDDRTDEENSY